MNDENVTEMKEFVKRKMLEGELSKVKWFHQFCEDNPELKKQKMELTPVVIHLFTSLEHARKAGISLEDYLVLLQGVLDKVTTGQI